MLSAWLQNNSVEFEGYERVAFFSRSYFAPIYTVFFGTIAINSRVISGSDPGAVPGGSTMYPVRLTERIWGRNRIDGRVKAMTSLAWAPLEARLAIVANDNFAEGELLAA